MQTQQNNQAALVTLPNSLRNQLERAQNLLSQSEEAEMYGNRSLAATRVQEAIRVMEAIAQRSPEFATLLNAALLGHRGFEFEMVEHVDSYQVVERKLFGYSFGYETIHTPSVTRRYIRGRFL